MGSSDLQEEHGLDVEPRQLYDEIWDIDVEELEMYRPGGFCPINIGDMIVGRFKIIHKLGFGGFATVWLAREDAKNRYVALKIIIANDSETYQKLPSMAPLLEQYPDLFLVEFEHFYFDSPNGNHFCQVSPVLGPTIGSLGFPCALYPQYARKWSWQMAHAVEVMHSNGLCHGDLTPSNVALRLSKQLDNLSEGVIRDIFPVKGVEVTLLPDHKPTFTPYAPRHAVQPMDLSRLPAEYLSDKLSILDFDLAFPTHDPPDYLSAIPPQYMAPETIFELKNGPSADVWALGCLMFRMRCGRDIFSDDSDSPSSAVLNMWKVVGSHLLKEWKLVNFDRHGWPIHGDDTHEDIDEFSTFSSDYHRSGTKTLREYIQGAFDPLQPELVDDTDGTRQFRRKIPYEAYDNGLKEEWMGKIATPISQKEADCFYDLMLQVFNYDTTKRITAKEILHHPWFAGECVPENKSGVE